MTKSLSISEIIGLERVAELLLRGRKQTGPSRRTFGGEIAGQAVLAAALTVPPDRFAHSAHMNFIWPGDTSVPIDFSVEKLRDGGSLVTRRVEAIQSNRVIFAMTASFQGSEHGLEHAVSMPSVPDPEDLPAPHEVFADDPENLSWATWLLESLDLDARFPSLPARCAASRGEKAGTDQSAWLRARREISDSPHEQAAALAYLSDVLLLSAALGPHGYTLQDGPTSVCDCRSYDLVPRSLRVDEWFLYDQRSRWAGNGRALAHGEIFDRSGKLCATTAQEGLIRIRKGGGVT